MNYYICFFIIFCYPFLWITRHSQVFLFLYLHMVSLHHALKTLLCFQFIKARSNKKCDQQMIGPARSWYLECYCESS